MRKILVLAANPADSSPLQLAREVHLIKEGLLRSRYRDEFEFVTEWAVGARGLRRALLDHQPEFIHFSGHGSNAGISLEDEQGATHPVGGDALAELFSHFAGHLRCVLLNACRTQPHAEAISQVIPFAVGMRGTVADDAAIEFSVGFYDAVGAGRRIGDAFAIGCNAIRTSGSLDHTRPVLYQGRVKDLGRAPRRDKAAFSGAANGHFSSRPGMEDGTAAAPFFQFLQTALRLGLQSGGRQFAPRIVGAALYAAIIAMFFATIVRPRGSAVPIIAFFALISLALLIIVLISLPDLNPRSRSILVAVVTLCLVGTVMWGAFRIAGGPAPVPGPEHSIRVAGRIRFQDHRPAEGVEVALPLLGLSDRTSANGTFSLGPAEYLPGQDTVDLRITAGDSVFHRRVALNPAALDIVLAYLPPRKTPPDTATPALPPPAAPPRTVLSLPSPRGPDPHEPDAREPAPEGEPEPRRPPEPTSGSVAGYVNAAIGGEQYKHFGMAVAGPGPCRLRGRVQVLRGGNRDVHIVVLTAEEFELYRVKGPYSEIFRERNTSDYTLDVELPGPGRYELVVSNRTSWLTPKYVLVENVRWECAGAQA